jgi:hypothetical protein
LEFINEYLALLEGASETADLERDLKKELALAAVATLRWMWETARTANEVTKAQLLSIAARRLLPIILKSYWLVPEVGRSVVEDVLGRIGMPDSSADEPYWLAQGLKPLIFLDASLVSQIYARIFGYRETSQESTHMGGIVLRLTSNKAQDYSMAYYALEREFPQFVAVSPIEATNALALALNAEVKYEHLDDLRTSYEDRPQFTFSYAGLEIIFVPDASEIWDHRIQEETSLKLLDWWLQHNAESIDKGELSVEAGADCFRALASHNPYAVTWKRLLEFAKHWPAPLKPFVLPLLYSSDILAAAETSVAAGDVIAAIYPQLGNSEKRAVEAAIMQTVTSPVSRIYKRPELVRNRLLGCIPQDDFVSQGARLVAEEQRQADRIPPNRPFISIGGGRAIQYTEEDWLKEKGVDLEQASNKEILEVKKPLALFEQRYLNEVPSTDEASKVLPSLRKAMDIVTRTATDDQLLDTLLTSAAGVAESILKISDLVEEEELVQVCRETLLRAAAVASPVSSEADEHFDRPMWGPTPQIEAAQGLMRYIWHFGLRDSTVLATLDSLSASRSPAVRFQVASQLLAFYKYSPESFWRLAERMMFAEQSTAVLNALLRTVGHGHVQGRESDKIVALYSARQRQGFPAQRTEDIIEVFSHVLVQLIVFSASNAPHELVSRLLADPLGQSVYFPQIALSTATYFSHGLAEHSGESLAARDRARSLALEVLSGVQNGFERLARTTLDLEERAPILKRLVSAIDSIVFRIYLASGANPALRRDDANLLNSTDVKKFFEEIRPILTFVTSAQPKHRYISPSTAQHLMELFNRFLEFDPVFIVDLAAQLCSANLFGYQFDPQAITEVTKLVETFLADHRQYLSASKVAANIGGILDLFIDASWPQATRILMSVDRSMA